MTESTDMTRTKKIIFIHGSPRKKGTTRSISQAAVKAAQDHSAQVVEIDAAGLDFKIPGCTGCGKCHQSQTYGCVIDDQLAQTVSSLTQYDVIVIATPTYWMSYPAQLKMLVDRMGSMMKFTESGEIRTPLAGKEFAVLATGNAGLENNIDLLEQQWRNIAQMMSCGFSSCLFPNTPADVKIFLDDSNAVKRAEDFGQRLALSL